MRSINYPPRVLVLSQPNFPVPAIKDGAGAMVIENTIDCLSDRSVVCVSLWDKDPRHSECNRKSYFLFKKNAWKSRLLRKLMLQKRSYRPILQGLSSNEQALLVALKWKEILYKASIIVVHTTKPEWVLRVKQLCGTKIKVVGYYHNSEIHLSPPPVLAQVIKNLDGHIFVSDFAAKSFLQSVKNFTDISILPVFTVKNGVDPVIFESKASRSLIRQQLNIDPEKIVLLFVGRLLPRKGLHNLLAALSEVADDELQNLVLIVAGSHDYYTDLQTDYIAQLHTLAANKRLAGKVLFQGYIPHKEISSYYQASDIFVFPSIELEGMPLTVMEAQMSSLPVIASAVGGVNEMIMPEVTGYLIDPAGNPEMIARYIELLVRSPRIRKQMGEHARQYALEFFSRERMASDFWNAVMAMV
jgi:glycosyltransferase involved in cell wall biosynthesis